MKREKDITCSASNASKRPLHIFFLGLVGVLLLAVGLLGITCHAVLSELRGALKDSDLRMQLQIEAGLPESEGISEAELQQMNAVLTDVVRGITPERELQDFQESFGYMPFSHAETALLKEGKELFDGLYGLFSRLRLVYLSAFLVSSCLKKWLFRDEKTVLRTLFSTAVFSLLPPAAVFACFARDFSGSLHYLAAKLFPVHAGQVISESSLLVRLFPESVLKGIAQNAALGIVKGWAMTSGLMLAILAIVYIVSADKRKKLKEDVANETDL